MTLQIRVSFIFAFHIIPILHVMGQMTQLHQDTSKWWIYYSDAFGIALLTLAITGMFIQKGDTSFSARGWKLALAGILFPLVFLLFLT